MTILLKKIIVYDENGDNPVEITDDERVTIKISRGGTRGSTFDITLKNAWGEHVNSDGEFKYGVDDIIKIWLKWATEPTDEIDTDSSSDLFMTAEIIDVEAAGEENSIKWTLNCMDRTFLLLNRLWAKNYPISESKNAPQLISEIINATTGTGDGTLGTSLKANLAVGNWSGGTFTRTGGGYIQNVRPDNSPFPKKSISKVFKPVYEWIDDLSQPDMTNTSTELSATGSPPAPRPYFFYVDEDNNCHWEYPDTTSPVHRMTWGSTTAVSPDTNVHYIKSFKLKKTVSDIVNMVIFNAGTDFYGSGILNYYYEKTSKSPKLKPVFRSWIDISSDLIKKSIFDADSAAYAEDNATPGTLTYQGKRYTASYNFTPHWSSTAVTTDATLNASLRNKAALDEDSIGKVRAQRLCQNKGNPRWKGSITLRGYKFVIGELVRFNSAVHGILNADVRINDVQHTITKNGWDTMISVEEDAEPITNG